MNKYKDDKKIIYTQNDEKQNVASSKRMRRFEKYFWITIIIFALIYLVLQYLANQNIQTFNDTPVFEKMVKTISKFVDDNQTVVQNLQVKSQVLHKGLKLTQSEIEQLVDREVDRLFNPVYANIDKFLDFHYSVIGEYMELGTAAFGNLSELFQKKLFGKGFDQNYKDIQKKLNQEYFLLLSKYGQKVKDIALKDVDIELNSNIIDKLNHDIEEKKNITVLKTGSFLGVAGISKVLSTKIATKISSKFLTKTAAKTLTKEAAASTAAAAGLTCGPLAWVCSPVAATVAWFGTDALVVRADEYLNRADYKNQIIYEIDKLKQGMKAKIKKQYLQSLLDFNEQIQQELKKAPVKKRVTIIEKITK